MHSAKCGTMSQVLPHGHTDRWYWQDRSVTLPISEHPTVHVVVRGDAHNGALLVVVVVVVVVVVGGGAW